MHKVLVVEDNEKNFYFISSGLKGKVEILHAETLEEGESIFNSNPDIDLIIMDACVPGGQPNAMPLVKKIVESGFKKPIIACSSNGNHNYQLMGAGATHSEGKCGSAVLALELLGLSSSQ